MKDEHPPTYDYVVDPQRLVDETVIAEVIEEARSFLEVQPESIREKLGRWATYIGYLGYMPYF